jgi:hypothetical protein
MSKWMHSNTIKDGIINELISEKVEVAPKNNRMNKSLHYLEYVM